MEKNIFSYMGDLVITLAEIVEVAVVDSQGRLYLRERVRSVAGIKPNSSVEVIARPGEIIIRPRKSVASEARGVFRLKKEYRDIRDLDELIKKLNLAKLLGELNEIR